MQAMMTQASSNIASSAAAAGSATGSAAAAAATAATAASTTTLVVQGEAHRIASSWRNCLDQCVLAAILHELKFILNSNHQQSFFFP